jgi:hypothetical protein
LKRPQRRPVPRAPRRRSSPRRHHHAPRPARSRARVPPLAKIIRRVVPHPLRLRDDVRVVSRVVSRVFVVSRVSRVVVARRVRRAAAIARVVVVVVVVVVVARTARVARRAVASRRDARDGARDAATRESDAGRSRESTARATRREADGTCRVASRRARVSGGSGRSTIIPSTTTDADARAATETGPGRRRTTVERATLPFLRAAAALWRERGGHRQRSGLAEGGDVAPSARAARRLN